MGEALWVDSTYAPWSFLLVTVILGGTAAFSAGRALAQTWRPLWQAFAYAAALAAASSFMHFVLFAEAVIPGARIASLLGAIPAEPSASIAGLASAMRHYAVVLATLSAFAFIGYRVTRSRAMRRQYPFDAEPTGPRT
jgi:hypothetical protein